MKSLDRLISSGVLGVQKDVARNERCSSDVIAENLDFLVIFFCRLVNIADPSAIQKDVCKLMDEREHAPPLARRRSATGHGAGARRGRSSGSLGQAL